jgi:hypothetical protein
MSGDDPKLPSRSTSADVDAFLQRVAHTPMVKKAGERGRLLFALDATASRQPTWDRACDLQAAMFEETAALGGLDVQLCYYRGFGEFHTTSWTPDALSLLRQMTGVSCLGGLTQIGKVLTHAVEETERKRINALVFVGDCMEEDIDQLSHQAGRLGILGVPAFLFQEGQDPAAERAFREIARLTRGAHCRFDAGSAQQLRDLLSAVAVFAAGGRKALADFSRQRGGIVRQLTHQVKGDR